ncbi:hypothetical protein SLA2020_502550 [Shorea laevis]
MTSKKQSKQGSSLDRNIGQKFSVKPLAGYATALRLRSRLMVWVIRESNAVAVVVVFRSSSDDITAAAEVAAGGPRSWVV